MRKPCSFRRTSFFLLHPLSSGFHVYLFYPNSRFPLWVPELVCRRGLFLVFLCCFPPTPSSSGWVNLSSDGFNFRLWKGINSQAMSVSFAPGAVSDISWFILWTLCHIHLSQLLSLLSLGGELPFNCCPQVFQLLRRLKASPRSG